MDSGMDNANACPLTHLPYYMFGTMQIHNPLNSHLLPWFDLIKEAKGVICEFGVYKGASLITTSLIRNLAVGDCSSIYGFDTFSGFPKLHEFDQPEMFDTLLNTGRIRMEHYEHVLKVREVVKLLGKPTTTRNLSTNTDFSDTSLELVKRKLSYFGLSSKIVPGKIEDLADELIPDNIEFALIDLDLYSSYKSTLEKIWSKMLPGGIVYLDEYFSLKFPGPRIAVDDFCQIVNRVPTLLMNYMGFPRYILTK